MVNADVFKTTVEEDLKEIAKAKLDILILQRQNETLCKDNDEKIKKFVEEIENRELSLEDNLSKSGEKKIETSAGWCAYRVMPDKWDYDIPKLISWANKDKVRRELYVKVVEEFKKAEFKKDFTEGLLEDFNDGVTITPQPPKFNYKLNGGL
uniref:Putative host-nuclease inhibitor protein n=1 Tax=viral metagenome TaxID=1070528 RepID=A0A6M3IF46_9ZZZZ